MLILLNMASRSSISRPRFLEVLLGVEVNSSVSLGQLDVPRWYGVATRTLVQSCFFSSFER